MADDKLSTYKAKRDFKQTMEPSGQTSVKAMNRRRFVIQKHDATRLHYDLRLELDGVFKSWAVTRGPSLDPMTSVWPSKSKIIRSTTAISKGRSQKDNMAAERSCCGTAALGAGRQKGLLSRPWPSTISSSRWKASGCMAALCWSEWPTIGNAASGRTGFVRRMRTGLYKAGRLSAMRHRVGATRQVNSP